MGDCTVYQEKKEVGDMREEQNCLGDEIAVTVLVLSCLRNYQCFSVTKRRPQYKDAQDDDPNTSPIAGRDRYVRNQGTL